jgi:NADH-quinone oxidoreductase subunit L
MWKLVFLGAPRSEEADHAHEGGFTLGTPLVMLAALSIVGGYGWWYGTILGGAFSGVLEQVPEAHGSDHTVVLITSVVVLLLGAVAAFVLYQPERNDALARKFPGLFASLGALQASFDRIYDYHVAKVQQRFAMLLNFLEQIFLAGVVIRGLAGIIGLFGLGARALHVGNANAYAYWFLLGVAALWAAAAGWLRL